MTLLEPLLFCWLTGNAVAAMARWTIADPSRIPGRHAAVAGRRVAWPRWPRPGGVGKALRPTATTCWAITTSDILPTASPTPGRAEDS